MHCTILTDFRDLEALASDWPRFLKRSAKCPIFSSWPWLKAWWRAYGETVALYTPVVLDGKKLAGALPLVRTPEGVLRPIGFKWADYFDLLCAEGCAGEILRLAFSALHSAEGWRHCVLDNVPAGSRILEGLSALSPSLRSRVAVLSHALCPAVALDPETRDLTLRSILQKESLRRHENKCRRLGAIRLRHIEDRDEIRRHLPLFFRQHIRRSAMVSRRSEFLRAECRSFFHALVEELDPASELRFAVLEIDGRPAAYHFGFQTGDDFVWYQPTFDVSLWDYSPGEVLLRRLFCYLAESGLSRFDFTVGDEPYKRRFANRVDENYSVHFAPRGAVGWVRTRAYRGKRLLKQNPVFSRVGRSVMNRIRAVRQELEQSPWLRNSQPSSRGYESSLDFLYSRAAWTVWVKPSAPPLKRSENVRRIGLGEIAELWATAPDVVSQAALRAALQRLRSGDVPYALFQGDQVRQVGWMGIRRGHFISPELPEQCRVPLKEPVAVLYDLLPIPGLDGVAAFSQLLSHMAEVAAAQGLEAWVCRRAADEPSFQGAMEEAGFRPKYRITQTRLAGLSCAEVTPIHGREDPIPEPLRGSV